MIFLDRFLQLVSERFVWGNNVETLNTDRDARYDRMRGVCTACTA